MTCAIAVVAHPARRARAEALAEAVAAEAISWDEGGIGCAMNHLQALEWLEKSGEPWSVVLEDDAAPVRDFRRQLAGALPRCPSGVCSLYLGRGRPPHWQPSIARREGALSVGACPDVPWYTAPELLHGVGYAVRTEVVPLLRRVVRRRVIRHNEPVDEAISGWLRATKQFCSYTRPSLVDHADIPTLLAFHPTRHAATDPDMVNRNEVRRAWRVGGRRDWTGGSLPLAPPEEGKS